MQMNLEIRVFMLPLTSTNKWKSLRPTGYQWVKPSVKRKTNLVADSGYLLRSRTPIWYPIYSYSMRN